MTATTNGTGRRISVHDATLKTATVEIKSLTISGKQMTLAVFRQLEEEDLIVPADEEHTRFGLAGVPWGWVNYCPGRGQCEIADGDARDSIDSMTGRRMRDGDRVHTPHRHLVWQQGDELRRCAIPHSNYHRRRLYPPEAIGLLLALGDLPQLFIAV